MNFLRASALRAWMIPLFFSSGLLMAQSGQISGLVSDGQQAAIASVSVEAENRETHVKTRVSGNEEGSFLLPSLSPGLYDLLIAAPGFEGKRIESLRVEVAGKQALTVSLQPGHVTDTVSVDGGGLVLNTVDATVSAVVDHRFVDNIPLNGRSLQALVTAIPGTLVVAGTKAMPGGFSGEFSINGARSESNYFTVDGVSANTGQTAMGNYGFGSGYSGSVSQLTALGTTHSMVSLDALQEFRGMTSTYPAEYGRGAGGQFAMLTRSGTDKTHGSLFEYLRNAVFDANAYFNKNNPSALFDRPKENQNDFGGALGGVIRLPGYDGHGRSFYFASYEGLQLRVPKAATMYLVPTMAARGQATGTAAASGLFSLLRSFPLPTANTVDRGNGLTTYYASFSTPSSIHAGSLRLDHSLNDRWKLFARYSQSPSETTPRYAGNLAYVTPNRVVVKTLTGGSDAVLTQRITNSLRANLTWNDNFSTYSATDFGGATPLDVTSLAGMDASSQLNAYFAFDTPNALIILKNTTAKQTQVNLVDSLSWSAGRHAFKFGADWRMLHTRMSLPAVWQIANFTTSASMFSGKPASGQARRFYGKMEPVYHNLSLYAQDEWTVTPRFKLSYGLRWELNPPPTDATGNNPYVTTTADPKTATLAPKDTPLYKTSYTNFAPRLGVAYTVHEGDGHQTVLRAGWGLYYDMGSTVSSYGYIGIGVGAVAAFNGQSFPLTKAQIDSVGQPSLAAPYSATVYTFDPDLKSPRAMQYSASIEQQFGRQQTLTISYIGTSGSKGLTSRQTYPNRVGNTNFTSQWPLMITTNEGESNYNALQAKFQKSLSHNLQALLSYTWAHSIDNSTSNYTLYSLLRGPSDYDVRQNFQATFTYNLPIRTNVRSLKPAIEGWAFDGRVMVRGGMPVDVTQSSSYDAATGQLIYLHPNRVANTPLYVDSGAAPGGRMINAAAFTPSTVEGSAGRNIARGFGFFQTDLTAHKDFQLAEGWQLQFRAEAFNLFNRANFGSIYNQLVPSGSSWTAASVATFGQAYTTLNDQLGGLSGIYQQGGARSMQMALRLRF